MRVLRERRTDVKKRPDEYARDINNEQGATHVACDKCDYERCQDI